ncbi:MAG: hypothetical protein A4S17_06950 [Proteobacteria bacterium HN_bin10]|jgi:hypothetical protein|nr:MAG: hypothetical protein A4S17_06950 [Proteobacteria bacterium HN_bin10]
MKIEAVNTLTRLRVVKTLHTLIWAFFASCVFAIPWAAWFGSLRLALLLIAIVLVEVAVLALNAWRCPLQDVAARYTSDRSGNFDIYLPAWLAQRTMIIFGPLFALGLLATALRWALGAI